MARLVVLRFEDNNEAEQFVKAVEQADVFFSHDKGDGNVYDYPDTAKVLGIWMQPTQYCTCERGKNDGFSKGRKYGLWVHSCGKPTRPFAESMIAILGGNNLHSSS